MLMGADHEVTARQELREYASQDLLLQRLRKVREGDIAAQHDIEWTVRVCDLKSCRKNSIPSRNLGFTQ